MIVILCILNKADIYTFRFFISMNTQKFHFMIIEIF